MRVLVLGATGFVGSAVARAFVVAGYQVFGTCRTEGKAAALRRNEITPVMCDLAKAESYAEALEDVGVIVHCALDATAPQKTDAIVVDAINAACRAEPGKTVIMLSSIWMYGEQRRVIDEATADNPPKLIRWRSSHEESVLRNECVASGFVLRCGVAYGRQGSLLSVYAGQAATHGSIRFPGDGANHMPMVHVDDIARACLAACESNLLGPNVFVVSASNVMVAELMHELATACELDSMDNVAYTGKPHNIDLFGRCLVMDQKADASFTRLKLGWTPLHRPFCDDAARYVEAMREFL
ncbi:NAD-dependent epimerase/dehydratase [Thecamonas trahens ATCC 50062]|uniref:NAD-dependent epimerase/dehydratase n=1 Tax=Thecamonas trahens ATCC 50062 TaxID=461836 RepID=A0A0L0D5C6_THETB|nr:NAD-dependent epimerase/dehydratase [Thecamonas trahens ATCC 50062]KNC47410.1 NAD-dependent epimerase/dehydratase [Thecamonas trahens ATCC 50062]|eukprot:XP_013759748.1 NAD-dependent epimerase/dehydratase [Thecamonas trahens ATCC 50062]